MKVTLELEDDWEHVLISGRGKEFGVKYWVTKDGIWKRKQGCIPGDCCDEAGKTCCDIGNCPFPHKGRKECPAWMSLFKLNNGEFEFRPASDWRGTWLPFAYVLYPLPNTNDGILPNCKVSFEKIK
jgi:hypothetical protein